MDIDYARNVQQQWHTTEKKDKIEYRLQRLRELRNGE